MFNFNTTPRLVIGENRLQFLGTLLSDLKIKNPLIVTGPNLAKTDIIAEAKKWSWTDNSNIFSDLVQDPTTQNVLDCVEYGLSKSVDGVIGIGGGSSLDVAKVAAVLLKQETSLNEIWGVNNIHSSRLPLILIPTTAGSGSEVTPVSIITTGETSKMGIVSHKIIPDAAILDPTLTVSCNPQLTAYSAIDAMVHAIESYTSINPNNNPYSKMLALEACRWLGKSTKTAILEPNNIRARADVQYGSMLAGQAFGNSPVAAVHALAYPLGGHFKLPHGLTNTLVLPGVLSYNQEDVDYAPLAVALFPYDEEEIYCHRSDVVEIMCRNINDLAELAGVKTQMRHHGISKDNIPMLAEEAMKQSRLLVNNPREITQEVAEKIYWKVL
jgi:alcohol dehydrogenase class IV